MQEKQTGSHKSLPCKTMAEILPCLSSPLNYTYGKFAFLLEVLIVPVVSTLTDFHFHYLSNDNFAK